MFSSFADAVLGFFESVLTFLHDVFEPVLGVHSWGWAIIALTVLVRIMLLPLAVKQVRSMRAMQSIQPEMRELQKKYKVDRSLMRKDPEQYRAKRQKLNEEMMALYKREGANPAASCLPMLAQAPIFMALFWTLREFTTLANQPFYFFTSFISEESRAHGLGAFVSDAGWPGWALIVVMSGSMFIMQKQMMARNAAKPGAADTPMAQQQKVMLYVLPVFLAVISFRFPLGILLYWVTTNLWQVGQQSIMMREAAHEAADDLSSGGDPETKGSQKRNARAATDEDVQPPRRKRSPGASTGRQRPPGEASTGPINGGDTPRSDDSASTNGDSPGKDDRRKMPDSVNGATPRKKPDHLPRRGKRND